MSAAPGLKGFVLAAGFGTRLKPLTDRDPKPLVPFCGVTALEIALFQLARLGVREVAINTHYLAERIREAVATPPFDLSLRLSHEPEILGTGGAYNPLRSWQGDDDLLVVNGDVVTDIDLGAVVRRHRETRALATMALLPEVIPGESGVFHDGERVVAIGKSGPAGARAGNFACVQVLSRRFVATLPTSGAFDVIRHGYLPALERGERISVHRHDGLWHDVGTLARYAAGVFDAAKRPESFHIPSCAAALGRALEHRAGLVLAGGAVVDPSARLTGPVVVERSGVVEAGALLKHVIVLPGGRVHRDEVLSDVIVGPFETRHPV